MYKKTILSNGLTVATHQMSGRVSVSLGIWIRAGARYERKGIAGISHFLEHILFKGTKRRTCEEIKQDIEGLGGSLNAFTGKESTCYLSRVRRKHFNSALDVLADMVLNAKLAPEDIETERKVILEEIRMYKDLPGHFVMDCLTSLLWPNQPLGMNTAGEVSSVGSITRDQLFAYKQSSYGLNNIVIVVCGSLEHKQVLEECKKCFSSAAKKIRLKKFSMVSEKQSAPQLNCQVKDTEQTHLALGLHGLANAHPERFALALLHTILGANMSSRLFRQLREERGLAYEIGTAVRFFQDTGAFVVHAGIDSCRTVEAVELILEQLRQLKEQEVGKQELARAKEYCTGQLLLALEDTSDYMLWLGESVVYKRKFLAPAQIIQRLRQVTADDLRRLANKIFQDRRLNLALIGPIKGKEKQIKKGLSLK